MKLILFDKNPEITEEFFNLFGDLENVQIHTGDFLEISTTNHFDSIGLCSAGNSYGIMGGGLDLAIARAFPGVEEYLRERIGRIYRGELPVGHSISLPLVKQYAPFTYLMYTPTMRRPTKLSNSHNVYLATRAVLAMCYHLIHNNQLHNLTHIALPGFGGQCGGLAPRVIAETMRLAYDRVMSRYQPQTHAEMNKEAALIQAVCHGKGYRPNGNPRD